MSLVQWSWPCRELFTCANASLAFLHQVSLLVCRYCSRIEISTPPSLILAVKHSSPRPFANFSQQCRQNYRRPTCCRFSPRLIYTATHDDASHLPKKHIVIRDLDFLIIRQSHNLQPCLQILRYAFSLLSSKYWSPREPAILRIDVFNLIRPLRENFLPDWLDWLDWVCCVT